MGCESLQGFLKLESKENKNWDFFFILKECSKLLILQFQNEQRELLTKLEKWEAM